jgi:16S rRNA (guanine527-N7)-methyltransferase
VKHLNQEDAEYLSSLLGAEDISISVEHQIALLEHLDWVLDWNPRVNLTAITEPKTATRLHILDSLLAASALAEAPEGTLMDLGSGAGFPGFPLAVVTGRPTVLIESVRKKAKVVDDFLAASGYGAQYSVRTAPERVEDYARMSSETASVVTARAVTQLGPLIELAAPLLKEQGVLVAMKGNIEELELAVAERTAELTGMRIEHVRPYLLPEGLESRTLVIVRRIGSSRIPLPRRNGLAQKQPIVTSPAP